MTDQQALAELGRWLKRARKLHPQFARDKLHGFAAIASEFYELQRAVVTGEGLEREKAEALDVAVTAMRFFMGEHLQQADAGGKERTCPVCGAEFATTVYGPCCSDRCLKVSRRNLEQKPQPVQKRLCEICGNEFLASNWKHKYCSQECRQIASQLNIREREKAVSQAHTAAISAVDSYSYGKRCLGAEKGCQAAL